MGDPALGLSAEKRRRPRGESGTMGAFIGPPFPSDRSVLALFSDFAFTELLVIAAISVMVFGRDLPRVAARAIVQFQKARRALQSVWRESGISEEVRRVQREMEQTADTVRKAAPTGLARDAFREIEKDVRDIDIESAPPAVDAAEQSLPPASSAPPLGVSTEEVESRSPEAHAPAEVGPESAPEPPAPESAAVDEPAGEAERRPAWYPKNEDPFGRPTD